MNELSIVFISSLVLTTIFIYILESLLGSKNRFKTVIGSIKKPNVPNYMYGYITLVLFLGLSIVGTIQVTGAIFNNSFIGLILYIFLAPIFRTLSLFLGLRIYADTEEELNELFIKARSMGL